MGVQLGTADRRVNVGRRAREARLLAEEHGVGEHLHGDHAHAFGDRQRQHVVLMRQIKLVGDVERDQQCVEFVALVHPDQARQHGGIEMAGDADMAHPVFMLGIEAGVIGAVAIIEQTCKGADLVRHLAAARFHADIKLRHLIEIADGMHLDAIKISAFRNKALAVAENLRQRALQIVDREGTGGIGRIFGKAARGFRIEIKTGAQARIVAALAGHKIEPPERLAIVHLTGAIDIGGVEIIHAQLDGAHDNIGGIDTLRRPLQRGLTAQPQRSHHMTGAPEHLLDNDRLLLVADGLSGERRFDQRRSSGTRPKSSKKLTAIGHGDVPKIRSGQ